ncbi:Na/Pi cotransporter family protein [Stappia sp. TSB10GB4]|uniref:Na/Pi cotransporter family protein n=1 Tax=Stappia sp. TSB10GB4 TaxID=2003584 RepID=UPI00164825D0|nr:Na/Pi symporter [Stappia sp. TSB10GB4]
MIADGLLALGGVGLFLTGMVILTDGLRALAGGSLRRTLARMTDSPASGVLAGAGCTAVLQSSSATTVTAVGFVGAGLMSFPQALGIVLGANIGTTAKGWVVALVGFKLDLGMVALPLLLAGALLRLLGRGRMAQAGWALTGFSLLFLGVDALKDGLAAFQGVVTPESFPGDTLFGRLQLVGIGILVTLITQSSSAGVVMALAALAAGSISLPQAAALVIGMDIGTTATALLASLGGSVAMRRTGVAHVVYNLMTATLAFALLTPFSMLAARGGGGAGDAQLALVAFHTGFNIVGVLVILPFAGTFARVIEWMVPDRQPLAAGRLDPALLAEPAAALDAAGVSARELAAGLFVVVADKLEADEPDDGNGRLDEVAAGISALRTYVDGLRTDRGDRAAHSRNLSLRHALDHLSRLSARAAEDRRIAGLHDDARLGRRTHLLAGLARLAAGQLSDMSKVGAQGGGESGRLPAEARLARFQHTLRKQSDRLRAGAIDAAAAREIDAETALARLDGQRWLARVAHHQWRIVRHLSRV